MAKKPRSASDPPSAWAIVLVAFLLILLPSLFCGGIMWSAGQMAANSTSRAHEPMELKKPAEIK